MTTARRASALGSARRGRAMAPVDLDRLDPFLRWAALRLRRLRVARRTLAILPLGRGGLARRLAGRLRAPRGDAGEDAGGDLLRRARRGTPAGGRLLLRARLARRDRGRRFDSRSAGDAGSLDSAPPSAAPRSGRTASTDPVEGWVEVAVPSVSATAVEGSTTSVSRATPTTIPAIVAPAANAPITRKPLIARLRGLERPRRTRSRPRASGRDPPRERGTPAPPFCAISRRATWRPSPVPLPGPFVVKRGSKIRFRASGVRPTPSSETRTSTAPSTRAPRTRTSRRGAPEAPSMASSAFATRFVAA